MNSIKKWFKVVDDIFVKGLLRHTKPVEKLLSYKNALKQDPCSYCGGPGGTLDHIIPKYPNHGSHGWDNLTGACSTCNGKKSSKVMLIFIIENGGLK